MQKQIEKLIKERKAHESEYERERSNRDNNVCWCYVCVLVLCMCVGVMYVCWCCVCVLVLEQIMKLTISMKMGKFRNMMVSKLHTYISKLSTF